MNLLLFLSDRCNMSCDYCFLDLNGKPGAVLSETNAARALDRHLAAHGSRARVTILGGEPLLHPDLALSVARRARAGGAKVTLVTNATKATPEISSALAALGVELSASVDGPAEVHDRHRRMAGGGPSHAAVAAALERMDPEQWRANLVLSEDTAGKLLSSVEWLRARGFRRLSFHADVRAPWNDAAHASLTAALEGFARYARALRKASPGALTLWHLDSFRARAPVSIGDELILGADGRYYASDAYLAPPYGAGLEGAIGDATSGPDLKRRDAFLSEAAAGCRAALDGREVFTSPVESWLLAKVQGRDPVAAVRAFARADGALGDALSSLAREAAVA
ncbi:MAG: radical SAM protein [Elusimicrobia bacterium]|nr:radical SAM protein [Elusimicrobiota bacterium]